MIRSAQSLLALLPLAAGLPMAAFAQAEPPEDGVSVKGSVRLR